MLNENTLKAMRGALWLRAQSLGGIEKQNTEAAILMYEGTQMGLHFVDSMLRGDTIASLWTIKDVYRVDKDENGDERCDEFGNYTGDITVEQARNVLRLCDSEHDASTGINWDTIEYWLERVRAGQV